MPVVDLGSIGVEMSWLVAPLGEPREVLPHRQGEVLTQKVSAMEHCNMVVCKKHDFPSCCIRSKQSALRCVPGVAEVYKLDMAAVVQCILHTNTDSNPCL